MLSQCKKHTAVALQTLAGMKGVQVGMMVTTQVTSVPQTSGSED